MKKYRKENLENIQAIFEEKTGVRLTRSSRHPRFGAGKGFIAVTALLCILGLSAFAYSKFSSLDDGWLVLRSRYLGRGAFEILVTNESDKELKLQEKVKLMQWSTAREVPGNAKKIKMEGGVIGARSEEVLRIDLSEGYDIALLEQGLPQGDWYYLVLTNNDFAFGQDWMCDIDFDENAMPEQIVYGNPREERKPDYPEDYGLAFADWVWPTTSRAVSVPYGAAPNKQGTDLVSDHVNIAGSKGDEIYAVAAGRVSEMGYSKANGNYIIIKLENDITVKYGHLQSSNVKAGDEVEQGQVIAAMGATGMATGANLAFTVWVNGETVNPLAQ